MVEACVAQLLQRGLPEEGILRVTPRPPLPPPRCPVPRKARGPISQRLLLGVQ